MTRTSPLEPRHEEAEAAFLELRSPLEGDDAGVRLVETFGELHAEYAAIRRAAALLDQPMRAVVRATGADRLEFLGRMITQAVATLEPHQSASSFWLNRKGRIEADLRAIHRPDETLLETDCWAAPALAASLAEYVFTEDVAFEPLGERTHRLALHGPLAPALLERVGAHVAGPALGDLREGRNAGVTVAGSEIVVDRLDSTGEPGLEMIIPADRAADVYAALLEAMRSTAAPDADPERPGGGPRARAIGWHAYNMARLEAGTPLFRIDFGSTNLPHESGVLHERVDFRKGCYLGQEVVARMESLGRPKQALRRLSVEATIEDDSQQPVTGDPVFASDEPGADPVGAVTSSAIAPMLGGRIVCFAQVKWKHAEPGSIVAIGAGGSRLRARVEDTLKAWRRGSDD